MQRTNKLVEKSYVLRKELLNMLHKAGTGHTGGSLSLLDILIVIYNTALKHKPKNPDWQERDRVILSAGHLCPALYVVLADQGYFPKQWLATLRTPNSKLQGHPEYRLAPGIENTSGPLGQGYAFAVGKALLAKRKEKNWLTYCLSSDGEHDEGAVWEAAQLAAHHNLGNLCVIIDRNNVQIDGKTTEVLNLNSLAQKYKSFGWHVLEINGHNHQLIKDALHYFTMQTKNKPLCIIAHTTLGKGVSFMEDNPSWHGKVPNKEELAYALQELEKKYCHKKLFHQLKKKKVLR